MLRSRVRKSRSKRTRRVNRLRRIRKRSSRHVSGGRQSKRSRHR